MSTCRALPVVVLALPFVAALASCGGSTTFDCQPACPSGFTCTEGGCVAGNSPGADLAVSGPDLAGCTCSGATPHCNEKGLCVACTEDSHCPVGQICKSLGTISSCVPGCTDDARCGGGAMKCCNAICTDTSKSVSHCGACGNACSANHAAASCAGGVCVAGACQAGWGDCNASPADGCETNLRNDVGNCGACGTKCDIKNAIPGCSSAEMPACYIAACKFGFDDCNGDPMDGCETSVLSDVKSCGGCGMACAGVPHAKVACSNAACILTACDQGFSDCDGNPKNGCEVATGTDSNNCGACGNKCGAQLTCINSACTCINCVIPGAKTKCVNLQCLFDQCLPGYADCDGKQGVGTNGCEVDLTSDPKNCGACGNVCPQNAIACISGVCTNSPCIGNPNWTPVTCTTPDWVWSMDSAKAKTVQDAAAAKVLVTGCMHGTPQPLMGQGMCSLDGKGYVSTKTFTMAGCNQSWWHIGGRFSGQCGGHDGDTYRLLVLTENDCYPY